MLPAWTARLAALRVERFLETEPVIWLSSIRTDGAPHLVPTWFVWDGEADRHPLQAAGEEGPQPAPMTRGRCSRSATPRTTSTSACSRRRARSTCAGATGALPAAFLDKYRARIAALGLTPAEFARTYSATIRLTPARALGLARPVDPAVVGRRARRLLVDRPAVALSGARARAHEHLAARSSPVRPGGTDRRALVASRDRIRRSSRLAVALSVGAVKPPNGARKRCSRRPRAVGRGIDADAGDRMRLRRRRAPGIGWAKW